MVRLRHMGEPDYQIPLDRSRGLSEGLQRPMAASNHFQHTQGAVLPAGGEPPWSRVIDGVVLGSVAFAQRPFVLERITYGFWQNVKYFDLPNGSRAFTGQYSSAGLLLILSKQFPQLVPSPSELFHLPFVLDLQIV
jgi:hypothetical protein